jgi:hypothetical protein
MALPNFGNEVPKVSAATATEYVQKLVNIEVATSGTKENAILKIARDYGLTPSQVTHLYKGRAKTCDVGLFTRIRSAYLDRCARALAALQHELALEEASSGDAVDQDLVDRTAALAAEVAAKRAAIHPGKEVR